MQTSAVCSTWYFARTFAACLCPLMLFAAVAPAAVAEPPNYVNPIIRQRADPWVYRHTDGWYYFTASVPEYDRIELRRAASIQDLGSASPVVVWKKRDSGPLSANIWAPEIHFIEGKWYIYFAAAQVEARFNHRIYVLESQSANPLRGDWKEKGELETNWSSFSLDATHFEHRGAHYLVWAQRERGIRGNSNLYIAAMKNPWTIEGKQVRISNPEFDWETRGFWVNEGPAVIKRNGRVFITYSASATDDRYCMGMLTAEDTADLLEASSWSKSATPVFRSSSEAGIFGPGHNSFTSEAGYDILVYHARSYRDIVGDPLYDPNRDTRAQVLGWKDDGTPDFGTPR
jgi:GH43 family beta-xylosidase